MKKYRLRKFKLGVVTFVILLYLEIIFRILTDGIIFSTSLIYILLFNTIVSLFIDIIFRHKVIYLVTLCLVSLMYVVDLCVYKMFGFFFDFSMLSTTDQVTKFMGDAFNLIISNIGGIILLFMPFLILSIFNYLIRIERDKKKNVIIKSSLLVVSICSFFLYLNIDSNAKKLYFDINNVSLNTREFGVINTFLIDSYRTLFGFSESFDIIKEEELVENSEYTYNNLEIDFDSLIEKETDSEVKKMHEYFKNETGTLKNEYTNYFKGKNLILFMAESFNEIGVSEEYTPTLYKLVHGGFSFNNFYTPTILSTIGGEFQELTGLVAFSSALAPWKSGTNSFPMGIATKFQEMGYKTYAYHDHSVYFQNRYVYLERLGFNNFKGCNNGLETLINCNVWPESDVEMIKATVNDYVDSEEPFMVYYATVSGHGGYSFSGNWVARKNKDLVSDLDVSESAKAYVATQIELDRALEELIRVLEEKGVLEDTVIALVGDHYPYFLSLDEVNELSTFERDSVVGVNKSNFILWNSEMDLVSIDKTGSQIDVLPTIYNLFGVNYDSRLIMGKDILSTTDGLAIFDDRSWVTDKGIYYAKSKKFVGNATEEYVNYINQIVDNRIAMSKNIIKYDYYKKVLGE